MPIDFYYMPMGSACRSCLLLARALGVELNLKLLNVLAGEQNKPEFLALNPQHCIPTMVDGDLVLWESRTICTYLVSQYGKDTSLYPVDPKIRALVDRLLFFDVSTLYHRYGEYVYPVMYRGQKPNPEKLEKLHEALRWLDGYIAGDGGAVGNTRTVADYVLVASVSTIEASGIDLSSHANVVSWLAKCKATMEGYDELNAPGAKEYGQWAKEKIQASS